MTGPVGLRARLDQLIEVWQSSHADWCCTKGCPSPDGLHFDDGGVREFLDQIGRGELGTPVPTHPCTGACSCDVSLYVSSLRSAIQEVEQA